MLEIVQVNEAEPLKPALSVALTVTEHVQAVVGVPVMAPLLELMDSPAGSPVAVHEEIVAVDDESWAELDSVEMAVPDRFDCAPGLVTVTVLLTVQVNEVFALNASESVAVTVTEQAHAVVGVPLMTPVPLLIVRPAGRPVAAKVTVLPPGGVVGGGDGQVADGRARGVGLVAGTGHRQVVDVPGQADGAGATRAPVPPKAPPFPLYETELP